MPIPLRRHAEGLPCHTLDPDLFFSRRPAEVAVAKAACARCHLRQQCLGRAIRHGEPWGVWGGETFLEGVVVRELRPPGRPPKPRAA